jgi:hypothetical protein
MPGAIRHHRSVPPQALDAAETVGGAKLAHIAFAQDTSQELLAIYA